MKQILIIDESPLFRDYLQTRFLESGIDASTAFSTRDGIAKLTDMTPDLIILDYHLSDEGYMEILRKKNRSIYTEDIPVIILARELDQQKAIHLATSGVKKVFTKPVKLDVLFAALSELLASPFDLDTSLCLAEIHLNGEIIFIEISLGLNRDKLGILGFKIRELVELYGVRMPKIIVMLSNLKLGPSDTVKIQQLMETILQCPRGSPQNTKILTRDEFFKDYIKTKPEYAKISVVSSLHEAADWFLEKKDGEARDLNTQSALIGSMILCAGEMDRPEAIELRFIGEARQKGGEAGGEDISNVKIAAVDDDGVVLEIIKNSFYKAGPDVKTYSGGAAYLADAKKEAFALVFLDLMMPEMDGFEVLREMQKQGISQTVIILSGISQRNSVIKAFQMGVKSYLVKPLKPEDIYRKAIEVLKANF